MKKTGIMGLALFLAILLTPNVFAEDGGKGKSIKVKGVIVAPACEHHATAAENPAETGAEHATEHASDCGDSCPHHANAVSVKDINTGKIYKLVPQEKQQKRVGFLNMALGHATMMADMHIGMVEMVTGIDAPELSGLKFGSSFDNAGKLVGKTVIVKGTLVTQDGVETIEVRKIRVEGESMHMHGGSHASSGQPMCGCHGSHGGDSSNSGDNQGGNNQEHIH